MKKINEFHPDRRQNLAESDKGSWFSQLSESEVRFSPFVLSFVDHAKTCASLNPRCGTCSLVCFCSDEGRRFRRVFPIVDHG